MALPLRTLTTLNRQQLGEVFKDPRTLLAFERIQLQVATIIPETFAAFQNLDFVVTVPDPSIPNAHVITPGANISVTPAAGLVTIKAIPSGTNGQLQYNNAGVFGGGDLSGDVFTLGSLVTTISAHAVTNSKFRQSAGLSLVGNASNATADVADITAALDGQVLRRSGTAIGFGAVNLASANAITGNLPVANLNSGTGAGPTTFWCGDATWKVAGSGTVTSVALSAPGIFTVSGSPVTTAGTLTFTLNTQSANLIWAGPTTGAAAAPTFRAMVAADLPNTAVTAGAYTSLNATIDAQGRITAASNGSGGSGTVTSVSSANGDLTVATGTTTPVLTINSAPKLVTARAIAMSGDVVWSTSFDGSGNVTAAGTIQSNAVTTSKISNSAVTLAKIANAAGNTQFLGSGSSGSGAPYAEQTISAGSGIAITPGVSGITIAATGASVPTTSLSPPQGRLTLVTGVPVMTSDQTAKTHIYYTPYVGAVVPVYSGSAWALATLSADLDMALDSTNQPAGNVYDLFVWNAGASIGAGPAWSNTATITVTIASPAVVTWTGHGLPEGAPVIFTTSGAMPTGIAAGTVYYVGRSPGTNSFNISTSIANAAAGTFVATSGSQSGTHTGANHTTIRGTGAGTTELQMLNGIWTNKNAITLANGAGAGTSVGANQATYLGSFYTTAAGQTAMSFKPAPATGGNNNFLALYNAYNRVYLSSLDRDSTGTYNYTSATWRPTDGSVANRVSYLDGLAQSTVVAAAIAFAVQGSTTAHTAVLIDATDQTPDFYAGLGTSVGVSGMVKQDFPPRLGLHYVQQVENSNASGTASWFLSGVLQALTVGLEM